MIKYQNNLQFLFANLYQEITGTYVWKWVLREVHQGGRIIKWFRPNVSTLVHEAETLHSEVEVEGLGIALTVGLVV